MKKVLQKMKQLLIFIVKNIKAVVVLTTIFISCVVFLATLSPRVAALETKVTYIEQRLTEAEHKFDLTSTKLETTLQQISTDLQIIKQKLLTGR